MKKKIIILLVSIFFFQCATSSAGISTSNIPIVSKKFKVLAPVEDKISWITFDFGIFGFPLTKPPVDELMTQILKEKQADALINIRYWNDRIILLFVTINRFGINADAVKFEDEVLNVVPSKTGKRR